MAGTIINLQYGYLIGVAGLFVPWVILYFLRRDLRKQMLIMSFLIGLVSAGSAYFWWTVDWWHPQTITHTKVGIEDFLAGFTSGGIMSVLYETIFSKKYYWFGNTTYLKGKWILVLLFLLTSFLFWFVGTSSFWSAIISMSFVALVELYLRRDLIVQALFTGAGMAVITSFFFYYPIILLLPNWVSITYDSQLSGLAITGIPIEEIIFWFLAGILWGPFYKYWKGEYLIR